MTLKPLKLAALLALVLASLSFPMISVRAELPPPRPDPTPTNSTVYFSLEQRAVGPKITPRLSVVSGMVEELVCAVTGKSTPSAAWRSLVKPGERIGIRVAAEPGPVGGTHPAVVKAVVDGLVEAGIPPENIIVWSRHREDLQQCGYDKVPGLNLRWVEQGAGYDPNAVVTTAAIGKLVYGDLSFKETQNSLADIAGPRDQLSNESHLPMVLSRQVDKVINIPSLCDSYYTGVNGALAGMTVGILDNWRRFSKGSGYGESALADVYSNDLIGKKVVLTLMDGMVLQYAGGPYPSPANCVVYSTLFASKDPVAIDATALRLIDEQRLVSKMPKASDDGGHVTEAAQQGLGNADEKMITLKRIGAGMQLSRSGGSSVKSEEDSAHL